MSDRHSLRDSLLGVVLLIGLAALLGAVARQPDLADLGTAFGLDASLADPAEDAEASARRMTLQPGWQTAA